MNKYSFFAWHIQYKVVYCSRQKNRGGQNYEKIYYEKFDYLNYDRDKIDAYIFSITLGCAFPDDKLLLITQLISSINQRNLKNPKIILMKAEITKDNPFALEYKEVNYWIFKQPWLDRAFL